MKPKSTRRFLSAAAITSVLVLSSSAFAGVIFKDVTTTDLNDPANWATTSGGATDPTSIGTTDTLRFNEVFAVTGGTMYTGTLSAPLTVGAIRLDSGSGSGGAATGNVTISGANTLTLNGNNDYSGSYLSGIVLNSSTGGTMTINSNIVVGASQKWVSSRNLTVGGNVDLGSNTLSFFSAGGTTTVSGIISGTGGIARTDSATGALILNPASLNNSYSGGTTISVGTLQVGTGSGSTATGTYTTLGSGAVNINGGTLGMWTGSSLTGVYTYANALNLNAGTLSNVDGNYNFTGAVSLTGANTVYVQYSNKSTTLAGAITGSGSFAKTGAGTLTLSGASSHTGAISIQNGTLNVNALNNGGTIAIGSGTTSGILNVTGTGETTNRVIDFAGTTGGAQINYNGPGLLRFTSNTTTTGSGAKGHTFGGSGNIQLDGNIVSNGGLTNFTKSGGGTLTLGGSLSLATGALKSNGGIVQLTSSVTSSSGANAMTLSRDNTLGGVLKIASGASVFTGTANTNGILGGWATYNNDTWAVTNGTGTAVNGLATFTSDWATATGNADITASNTSGALTVNSLRFNTAGALTQTLSGANVVTSGGILVTSAVGANDITITGGTSLNAGGQDLIIHQNNTAGALNIASTLIARITKSGAGTVNLSGSSTSSGNTVINEGVLSVTATGKLYDIAYTSAPTITINSSGTLKLNSWSYGAAGGTGNLASNAANRVLNGGTLEVAGATQSGGSAFTVNAIGGTFRYNPADTTNKLTMTGSSVLNGTLTYDAVGNINVNAGMSGVGGVVKTGGKVVEFTADNTYSGLTTVNNGTLKVSAALRNTSGLTVNAGATAELASGNIFTGGHGSAMDNSRVLTANDGGTLLMSSGMVSRIGNVTLNNGSTWTSNQGLSNYDVLLADTSTGAATVSVTGTGASTMNGTGGIHLQGIQNFAVANVTNDTAADLTVSMTLGNPGTGGGPGGINKTGDGTMAISKQTEYTGGTTVTNGVLDLTGGGGGTGTIRGIATVNTGATLRLSTVDALGYTDNTTRVTTLNLTGGTLHVNTLAAANQTLAQATINMTGGSITGIATSNIDLFGDGAAINALASASTSTISGITLGLRQDNTAFTVADGTAATDLQISSVITDGSANQGNHNLIKAGAGTMELTGTNTYTGKTTISDGTLKIGTGGSIAATTEFNLGATGILASTSALTIGGGVAQKLTGTGTVQADLTIGANGTHAVGSSPGLQTVEGSLSYAGSSLFSWDLKTLVDDVGGIRGTDFDAVNVTTGLGTGNLDIDPSAIFRIVLGNSGDESSAFWNANHAWNVFDAAGTTTGAFAIFNVVDSTFASAPITSPGAFTFNGSTGTLNWSAVPEPTSALAGLLIAAGLLRRRRVA